jgi:antitoxin YefM
MEQVKLQDYQSGLETLFNQVIQTQQAISVVRDVNQAVVILDAREYNSLMETLFLSQPAINDQRLRKGIEQHREGQVREIDVTAYLD